MARLLKSIPSNLGEGFRSGIDVIGDIAVLRDDPERRMEEIAATVLKMLKNVKAVYSQEGGIEGEFRLRSLRRLAGERRTVTLHRENGCQFQLDIASCYFSPRLSTERLRIAEMVKDGERVLNMFAGVGVYSITIAKRRAVQVESCELNAIAYGYHVKNNQLNKVSTKIHTINEDAANLPTILETRFDRILMPHPSQADRFLPAALALAGKKAVIHYYRHVSAETFPEARKILKEELASLIERDHKETIRRVREVGKRFLELAADVTLD